MTTNTPDRLIVQPKPQLATLVVLGLVLLVGLFMFSSAKLTTVACDRDAGGRGRCVVTEAWLIGHRVHPLDLREVTAEVRRGSKGRVSSYLVTPSAEFVIGGRANGEQLDTYLQMRAPGPLTLEDDQRGMLLFLLPWCAFVLFMAYQYTVTTTVCFDRTEGRARVFFQGPLGKRVREVPLSDVAGIEVAAGSKAMVQLAARLKSGGTLSLVPPFVIPHNKQALADELKAFLASTALGRPVEPRSL